MRILITGAAGFIGQIVTKALLEDKTNSLILTDTATPTIPPGSRYPQNAQAIQADLTESPANVVSEGLDSAILLHGIMSSAAEANLELGYRVNVKATWSLIEALAQRCQGIRILYASSEAVYGSPVPKSGVTEADIPTPEMSYGCQKVICEALINDYTRRGLINGFSLRFPTISVRPGKPSPAVSAFLSGIIREPMNGEVCVVPLKDRAWKHWMCSPRTLVSNILVALDLSSDALSAHRRSINMPGFAVTIQGMLDALEEVGGRDKLDLVQEEERPGLRSLLYSWADNFDNSLALKLGMTQDVSFVQSVRDYMETIQHDRS